MLFIKRFLVFTFLLISNAHVSAQKNPSYFLAQALPSPRIFGEGIISSGDYESHPAFTITGDTLYFLKSGPDLSKWTICVSYFRGNRWSAPQVAPFSGQYMDADPFITKDGKELYFISNRPLKEGDPPKDFDIWKMQRTKTGWSKPTRLPVTVNSDKNEYYPTLADNGTLYFGSRRDGGKGLCDLYKSAFRNGTYQEPENLGDGVNTKDSEYEPLISPDETYLIFMAAKPDHLDNADLYLSYNRNGQWSIAKKLPAPFNSEATEFSPKVSRDEKYFFFSSSRNKNPAVTSKPETTEEMNKRLRSAGNGVGDIYQVDFDALKVEN